MSDDNEEISVVVVGGGGGGEEEGEDRAAGDSTATFTRPSNYENAWLALRNRGIGAAFAERSLRFERDEEEGERGGGAPLVETLLARCLQLEVAGGGGGGGGGGGKKVVGRAKDGDERSGGVDDGVDDDGCRAVGVITKDALELLARPAVKAMDDVHANEEAFSAALFGAVARCFEGGGWTVQGAFGGGGGGSVGPSSPSPEAPVDAPPPPPPPRRRVVVVRQKGRRNRRQQQQQHPIVAVAAAAGDSETAGDPAQEEKVATYTFDDMVIVGRREDYAAAPEPAPAGAADAAGAAEGGSSPSTRPLRQGSRIEMNPSSPPEEVRQGNSTYVCRVGGTLYAVGLSRKVMMKDPEGLSIIRGESFPDHAVIIYQKKADADGGFDGVEWTAHRLLASVELKREGKSGSIFACMTFPTRKRKRTGTVRQGDGGGDGGRDGSEDGSGRTDAGATIVTGVDPRGNVKRNGPLAQALAYTVGHALPGRAALGLGLSKAVPFAVLAGKRGTKAPSATALRYVHGNVITPETCGGCYSFNVDAFGAFDGESTGRHALAAYLDVVLSGLKAGRVWLAKQKKNGGSLLAPMPLCGRRLTFGAKVLSRTPSLRFSPLRDKDNPTEQGRGINASQGEIFSATVDLTQLQETNPDGTYVSWFREPKAVGGAQPADSSQPTKSSQDCETSQPIEKSQPSDGSQPVLIKVVSRACFGLLVGREGILWKHEFGHLRRYLSPSLHGVCTIYENGEKRGLVQIMPDLTSDKFEPLRPVAFEGSREKWKGLWTAFRALIQNTLIPLAEADVIHPDLRPGRNRTANLLYSPTFGEIRIIDLDSLVLFPDWVCADLDDRYLTKTPHPALPEIRTALEFLFYQVVVITDTWLKRIKEEDVNAATIVFNNTMIEDWTRLDPTGLCDRAFIHTKLDDIGADFGCPTGPDA